VAAVFHSQNDGYDGFGVTDTRGLHFTYSWFDLTYYKVLPLLFYFARFQALTQLIVPVLQIFLLIANCFCKALE